MDDLSLLGWAEFALIIAFAGSIANVLLQAGRPLLDIMGGHIGGSFLSANSGVQEPRGEDLDKNAARCTRYMSSFPVKARHYTLPSAAGFPSS